jgi:hypothetical protein
LHARRHARRVRGCAHDQYDSGMGRFPRCELSTDAPPACRFVADFILSRRSEMQNPLSGVIFDCPASLQRFLARCRPESNCTEPTAYNGKPMLNCGVSALRPHRMGTHTPTPMAAASTTTGEACSHVATPSCRPFCTLRHAESHCRRCQCRTCPFCWAREAPPTDDWRGLGALREP